MHLQALYVVTFVLGEDRTRWKRVVVPGGFSIAKARTGKKME